MDTATGLSLDIDGDRAVDIMISSGDKQDTVASLKVLIGVIETLDIHKGLKKEMIKKTKKVIKEFKKGKTDKAIKKLNKIIKKLEKEIKKNLKIKDEDEAEHKEKEKKHKDKKTTASVSSLEAVVLSHQINILKN